MNREQPLDAASRKGAKRKALNPATLAFIGALWIASVCNWPLWRALTALPEMQTPRGALFTLAFFGIVTALTTAMLSLFAWRRSIKPALAFCLVSAAIGAYFMGTYGVVLDPSMMTNMLQTNARETLDLLNAPLLGSLALLAALPLWWVWRIPVAQPSGARQAGRNAAFVGLSALAAGALVSLMFADMAATMRNHKSMRYLINPVNSFYSLGVALKGVDVRAAGPLQTLGRDAAQRPHVALSRPPLLMLVIGETARADHFSLNGYGRPTNPELARLGVTSFTDVTSCGTNTAASLPCMFSGLGRSGFVSRTADSENLLDVLQQAGLAVLWIDNQSGCKGVCDRVPHASTGDTPPGGAPLPAALCIEGECLDEALLLGLDQRIAALPAERRAKGLVLVMHQMGSHGPAYSRRAPPDRKPFTPECTTNVLQQCEHDQLINAYDNSIAYTDHVLGSSIEWLARQGDRYSPALLYVSDHGESLGEHGLYLHGMPYQMAPRAQTHVPMLVWLAPRTASSSVAPAGWPSAACLASQRDAVLSHDNLFHTVLGLVDVATSAYKEELDAFAPCRPGGVKVLP